MVKTLMISKLRSISDNKKRLLSNLFSLSVLQGANYLLPLITLPYLVRVLGPEKFGLIVFAQAFTQFFCILTDYGFNLSATREISIHRKDKQKVSEIFTSVLITKFVLLILSLIIFCVIVFSVAKLKGDWQIYFLTFGMVIGQVLFPVWFFQGIERMKYIAILNILARTIFTTAIFLFVRHTSDFIYVPLINSTGFFISGLMALFISLKYFNVQLIKVTRQNLIITLRESFHFFATSVFSDRLVFSTTMFLVGVFYTNTTVGYLSVTTKLISALVSIRIPITASLYPFFSKKFKESASKAILNIFKLQVFFSFVYIPIILAIIVWAEEIITMCFGSAYVKSAILLKITSVYILLNMYNSSVGLLIMFNIGLKSHLMWIKIIKYIFLVFLLLVGLPYSALVAPVCIIVLIELAETVLYGVVAIKSKLWRVCKYAKDNSEIIGLFLPYNKLPII